MRFSLLAPGVELEEEEEEEDAAAAEGFVKVAGADGRENLFLGVVVFLVCGSTLSSPDMPIARASCACSSKDSSKNGSKDSSKNGLRCPVLICPSLAPPAPAARCTHRR